MTSVTASMRTLRIINEKCGGTRHEVGDKFKFTTDTTNMSKYTAQQAKTAERMRYIRQLMAESEGLEKNASRAREVEVANRIRKELKNLKQDTQEAGRLAIAEKKKPEFEQLQMHAKKTEQLYKSRFSVGDEGYGSTSGGVGSRANKFTTLQELDDVSGTAGSHSLREDEEFAQFFEQTQEGDVKIDKALDRISHGVQRVHENAKLIGTELAVQQQLLEQTEEKVDAVSGNLKGVNKRLNETLKKVDQDKMCLYVFCFFILLGLGGVIYFYASGGKK